MGELDIGSTDGMTEEIETVYRINMTPAQDIVEEKIQSQGWGYVCDTCGHKWMYSLALLGNKDHKIKWNEDQAEPPCGFARYYNLKESKE